ncbi:hypothetical protein [Clostridium pasteurianum]|uniref:Uncharacterized protein n=1 Tax=Clostridium pasteurianum BC1 TaxID=86416 RepID=R4K3F1_CLOPA|nr:hypothetical protein [Clostridium pasteurianum]AGK97657.1 hypothetical protein Clopa_2819 [Clostridium pasteurianum BC1]
MSAKELFNYYYKLQSKEMREDIESYKKLAMKNKRVAIKVIFKNGQWLRVYQKLDGSVEWY